MINGSNYMCLAFRAKISTEEKFAYTGKNNENAKPVAKRRVSNEWPPLHKLNC